MALKALLLGTSYRTIDEVAQHLSMTTRTIRNYVEKGVISAPVRVSRRAYYSDLHVRQLANVKKQMEGGKTLAEIANARQRRRQTDSVPSPLRKETTVRLIPVVHGITLQVAVDLGEAEKRVLKKLMAVRQSAQSELTHPAS